MPTVIQVKRGTAAQWTSANTILAAGEAGFETDTKKMKIGDGSTAWNSLGYIVTDGDITGVTAGTGLTGGGSSGAVTLNLDTSSSYVVPSQTGHSGKYLTTNGTASSWGTVAGGSGMTSIASGSLSGTSVVLSLISSSYNDLRLIVRKPYFASNASVNFRINSVTNNTQWNRYAGPGSGNGIATANATSIPGNFNALENNSNSAHIMILDIMDYNSSTYKIFRLTGWYQITDGSSGKQFQIIDGAIHETNVVSSIEIYASTTFSGGTYQLYGIK